MADKVYLFRKGGHQILEDDDFEIPAEYEMFLIIRSMGWDYWTYSNQPDFFIEMCSAFINAENRAYNENKRFQKGNT